MWMGIGMGTGDGEWGQEIGDGGRERGWGTWDGDGDGGQGTRDGGGVLGTGSPSANNARLRSRDEVIERTLTSVLRS